MNTSEWRAGVQGVHDEAAGLLNVDHDTIVEKATAGLRRIWPDLRPVVITHPGGGVA
jgi:hypothetical protein